MPEEPQIDGVRRQALEPELAALRAVANAVQARIIGGLLVILPVAITFWILYQLYSILQLYLIGPVAYAVRFGIHQVMPAQMAERLSHFAWAESVLQSLIAIGLILLILWFLGLFVRSRIHRAIDWLLLRVPLVTHVYKAVSSVFKSMGQAGGKQGKRRVVLVNFPSTGLRTAGFVTSSCVDLTSGQTILCIFVPMAPFPTSGFLVMAPEKEVVDLEWDMDDTLQAIISGGMTVPQHVRYFRQEPEVWNSALATVHIEKGSGG